MNSNNEDTLITKQVSSYTFTLKFLIWEALMRLVRAEFMEWLEGSNPNQPTTATSFLKLLSTNVNNINTESETLAKLVSVHSYGQVEGISGPLSSQQRGAISILDFVFRYCGGCGDRLYLHLVKVTGICICIQRVMIAWWFNPWYARFLAPYEYHAQTDNSWRNESRSAKSIHT